MSRLNILLALLITSILLTYTSQAIVLRTLPTQVVVNEDLTGQQIYNYIYMLDNEYIVIVWFNVEAPTKLYYQIYDPVGIKVGTNKSIPTVASKRNFVVPITGSKFVLTNVTTTQPYIQIYDYLGNPVAGPYYITTPTTFVDCLNIAKLDDGNLILGWIKDTQTISFAIMTLAGSVVNEFSYTAGGSYTVCALTIESTANNRFGACWQESSTNIQCKVYNTSGAILYSLVPHVQTICMQGYSMNLKRMVNDDLALAYNYTPSHKRIYIYAFNSNGTVKKPRTEVQAAFPGGNVIKQHPNIGLLSDGRFFISFDVMYAPSQAYLQLMDTTYQEVNSYIQINTSTKLSSYMAVTGTKRGGYAVSFNTETNLAKDDYDIVFQLYYGDETNVLCTNLTITMKTVSLYSLTNDFMNNISDDYMEGMKVKLGGIPSSGSFQTQSGTVITTDPMSIKSFNYSSGASGVFVIDYSAVDYYNNQSSVCKLTINVCYESCETCTSVGVDENHLCTSCKTDYPHSIGNANCYQTCPEELNGKFYYTQPLSNTCKECTSPCQKCSDANKCVTCATGFYKLENQDNNNCVSSCPTGYKISGTSCVATDALTCGPLCSACSETAYNCSSCIEAAYFLSPNECRSDCPSGYDANSSRQCITCKSLGKYIDGDHCVDSCSKGIRDTTLNLCNETDPTEVTVNAPTSNGI
jgi:hypothetical protein